MSFNIVKKNGSTCLVEKFRDPSNPKKVVEKYMCSLGVQTNEMHVYIRNQVNDLAQEDRLNWCEHSGLMVETSPDTPRRKAPTGDKRAQKPKKERKARKQSKKAVAEVEDKEIEDIRPAKQDVVLKKEAVAGIPLRRYKTKSAKKNAITSRITEIEEHIVDQDIYLKHYKSRQGGLSKSEKQMRIDEADRYTDYKSEGTKAIKVLRKQRSELR